MSVLYHTLRWVARVALRWFYRSIEVVGRERVPAVGPVILAANHNNALVDALIVATSIEREVRLTAKAALLEHPVTRLVVLAAGIVPLRRRSDEAGRTEVQRNDQAFQAVVSMLADGGAVLVFPEGISHSGPQLAPLRTGCARMALQALDAGILGVTIVPVGLTFEQKAAPRSSVVMQVGLPIDVATLVAGIGADTRVDAVTFRIDEGVRAVTLNFPTDQDALRVLELSRTLGRLFDRLRELHEPDSSLADSVRVARRLDEIRQLLPSLPPALGLRVEQFLSRLQAFADRVSVQRIPLNDIWMPATLASGAWFILREVLLALPVTPVALWGRLNHWIPLRGALWLGRATSKNPDEPAMRTIVLGVVFVLITYLAVALVIAVLAGWIWAAAYLVSLPVTATVDFWLGDRWKRALYRARGYLQFRSNPELQQQLIEEAAWLRAEGAALNALID